MLQKQPRDQLGTDPAFGSLPSDPSCSPANLEVADRPASGHHGRLGDGMVAAIERVGAVLSEHFPRSEADTNEIPDKLIEL